MFYQDNGIGFDYALMQEQGTGIGLRSLKNRAELMGGSFKVESRVSKGSAFLFEFPLPT